MSGDAGRGYLGEPTAEAILGDYRRRLAERVRIYQEGLSARYWAASESAQIRMMARVDRVAEEVRAVAALDVAIASLSQPVQPRHDTEPRVRGRRRMR